MIMIDTQYVKERRCQEGLRLKDMAEKLGYESPNGYWRLERGLTKLRVEHLVKLARVFDEPIDRFIRAV